MGKKLRRVIAGKEPIGWAHYCPGCHSLHVFNIEQPTKAYPEFNIAGGAVWTFNGSHTKPTFAPSMHVTVGGHNGIPRRTLCHYFLREGVIEFLSDSAHSMKGQTVPLPSIPRGMI